MTNEEKIRAAKHTVHKLVKVMSPHIRDQVSRLETSLKEVNPIKLMIYPGITFETFDPSIEYYWNVNWVLIGSMGDPKTWGGSETVVTMKKGDEDGLAGCLIDLNILQEILYKRPSGTT